MTDGPGDPDARSLQEQLARETERRTRAEEAMRTAEQEKADQPKAKAKEQKKQPSK